jgi:hypothetical protein
MLLSLVIALSTMVANGQFEKGAWILVANSNFGFNSYTAKGSPNNSLLNINSRAGYFVANNFACGLNLGLYNFSTSGGGSTTLTTIGVFVRGFLSKGLFLGGGLNTTSRSGASKNYSTFPFEFGYAALISKRFAIEPSLNYVVSGDDSGGVPTLGVPGSATSSFGFNVGFTFYFNRQDDSK